MQPPSPSTDRFLGRMTTIRVALLGAGIFAREAHAPALQSSTELQVVVVWSRTESSAAALAATLSCAHASGDDGLQQVLQRDDVDCVDVVLPICEIPRIVRRAWAHGKHVLSEKPVAPDGAAAAALIAEYNAGPRARGLVWLVSENWRFHPAIRRAAHLMPRIGAPRLLNWPVQLVNTKYAATEWRREPGFRGGFMLDAGIHFVAALRHVLGEVRDVSCVYSPAADAGPPTSLAASLAFQSGAIGAVAITFATDFKVWELRPGMGQGAASLSVAGASGGLVVDRDRLLLTTRTDEGEVVTEEERFPLDRPCVKAVLSDFARAVRGEGPEPLGSPEESYRDLLVLEAMFDSADQAGARVSVAEPKL